MEGRAVFPVPMARIVVPSSVIYDAMAVHPAVMYYVPMELCNVCGLRLRTQPYLELNILSYDGSLLGDIREYIEGGPGEPMLCSCGPIQNMQPGQVPAEPWWAGPAGPFPVPQSAPGQEPAPPQMENATAVPDNFNPGGPTIAPLMENGQPRRRQNGRGRRDQLCVYCRSNQEPIETQRSHILRRNGIVECPMLRRYECPICHATGDTAHSLRHCPFLPHFNPVRFQRAHAANGRPTRFRY